MTIRLLLRVLTQVSPAVVAAMRGLYDRRRAGSPRLAVLPIAVGTALWPALSAAQGFGINEQGTCAMSRAGAAVAEPCRDGSAIYVNPAGLADGQKLVISGGGTLIIASGSFIADGGALTELASDPAVVPHAYLQYTPRERIGLGIGLYAPYGLGVKWPLEFEGRFVGYDSHLATAYIQPTAAYAISDQLWIGGGLTIAVSSVDLRRREDLAEVPLPTVPGATFGALVDARTDFADTALTASGATGVGVNLGLLVNVGGRFRAGARYLSKITLDYEGDVDFSPLAGPYRVTRANPLGIPVGAPLDAFVSQVQAALRDQPVRTTIAMPAQFEVGVSVPIRPGLKLFGDYHWVGWSSFESVRLDFAETLPPDEELPQNYRDTSALRLGAELQVRPTFRVSGGYIYNQAAAPDETVTPLLPESERNHFTGGFGWDLHRNLTLDFAYQFLRGADRRGRVVEPPSGQPSTVALNSGVYRSRADLLGVTLTFRR